MKLLGFAFLLVLVFAAVGYVRGWFSITTAQAGDKSALELTLDKKKLSNDAKAVTGQESQSKDEGVTAEPAANEVSGVITVVDVGARNLTFRVGPRTIVQHVPMAVAITRDGARLSIDKVLVDMRAKLVFDRANEPRELLRIEILR